VWRWRRRGGRREIDGSPLGLAPNVGFCRVSGSSLHLSALDDPDRHALRQRLLSPEGPVVQEGAEERHAACTSLPPNSAAPFSIRTGVVVTRSPITSCTSTPTSQPRGFLA
jgi:hypothetical protein